MNNNQPQTLLQKQEPTRIHKYKGVMRVKQKARHKKCAVRSVRRQWVWVCVQGKVRYSKAKARQTNRSFRARPTQGIEEWSKRAARRQQQSKKQRQRVRTGSPSGPRHKGKAAKVPVLSDRPVRESTSMVGKEQVVTGIQNCPSVQKRSSGTC